VCLDINSKIGRTEDQTLGSNTSEFNFIIIIKISAQVYK
jgi:hypothetical protein